MLNRIILMGRLTREPELRHTQQGTAVASFSLAVDRNGREKATDFVDCVAWRQTAEFITRFFHKASSICVVGTIQTRSWTDQQGQKRYSTEVVVDEAMFVDARGEGADTGASFNTDAYGAAPSFSSNVGSAPNFEEHNTDDDLPF